MLLLFSFSASSAFLPYKILRLCFPLNRTRQADKHGIFIVLTSWEYQALHTIDLLADPSLRNGLRLQVPRIRERARVLSRKWGMLLTILKQEDLLGAIAYVEIHNEWTECDKEPAEEAISYLTARFPGLLFCMDCDLRKPANGRFDFNYPRYEERMLGYFKNMVQYSAHAASRRGIPAVCDEGYIDFPPTNSQFEWSPRIRFPDSHYGTCMPTGFSE